MRRFRHIAAFALSTIMAVSLSVTAFAADTVTMYRTSKTGASNILLTVEEEGVKMSSITTNVSWLNPQALGSYKSTMEYMGDLKDKEPFSEGDSTIGLKVSNSGSAKVTYEAGSKSYTKDIVILPYTNPVQSVTVSALNNGKNMASKTKNSSVASNISAKFKSSNQTLKVTAASGWKITYIGYSNTTTGHHAMRVYTNSYPRTADVNIGKITKKTEGIISITLMNTKTGGEIEVDYYFGDAKK